MFAVVKRFAKKFGIGSRMMRLRSGVTKRIVGDGNVLSFSTALLRSVDIDIVGNGNEISISDGCVFIGVKIHIRGDNHKIIVDSGCRFNGGGMLWIEDRNGHLNIGKNSTFENVSIAITEPFSRVDIGEDCMFAYDIDIRTGDSHSILDLSTAERVNFAANVFIDDHVWIAAHCILLKGVRLGEGSVVAAGACVTKAYEEPNIILAGNPAKIVKRNISWSRERLARDGAHQ